jgi:hypothetical protein
LPTYFAAALSFGPVRPKPSARLLPKPFVSARTSLLLPNKHQEKRKKKEQVM